MISHLLFERGCGAGLGPRFFPGFLIFIWFPIVEGPLVFPQMPEPRHQKHFWGLPWWHSLLRILLPMQGTRVRALVREDPTCHRASKPVRHNY